MSTTQLINAAGAIVAGLPLPHNPPVSDDNASDYNVVAVVGCQSGGKSTLLNYVFGTSFPVLDAPTSGRRRTTLGVWGALSTSSADAPRRVPTVVLDIEGTDSRERGEGARSFESRTTLFALALADVVLVNMWAHDLGRHTAANYDLFETVFAHAVALRRAHPDSHTRAPVSVLIVVRDHDGESDVSDIRRVLMGDLNNIWDGLRIRGFSLTDLFDLDVITLPHKLYDTDGFVEGTAELRLRVEKEALSRGARAPVPLDGFNALARAVWDGVCNCTGGSESSTLDLPRHASLAAYFRLGQAVDAVLSGETGSTVDELRTEIETQWQRPIEDFLTRVDKLARVAFSQFDKAAAPYRNASGAGEAPTRRRAELGHALSKYVAELRERHLSVCRDFCMNEFEDKFRPMLAGTSGFDRKARRLANSFVRQYRSLVQDASMPNVLQPYVDLEEDDVYGVHAEKEDTEVAGGHEPNSDTMTDVVDEAYHDEVDQELGLIDSDEEEDEYSVDKFRRDVFAKVEERRQLGEVLLPGAAGGMIGEPKRDPWWKGLLIRGVILLINYLQASQGQRAALRLIRKHETEFPPTPTF